MNGRLQSEKRLITTSPMCGLLVEPQVFPFGTYKRSMNKWPFFAISLPWMARYGSERSFLLIISASDDLVKVSWKSDAGKCQNQLTPPCFDQLKERHQPLWPRFAAIIGPRCAALQDDWGQILRPFFKLKWLFGTFDQNKLYHTKLLLKIWDLGPMILFLLEGKKELCIYKANMSNSLLVVDYFRWSF